MDDRTKKILLFIGGVIWAMKSSTKAYAPTLNVVHAGLGPVPPTRPQSQSDCPPNTTYKMGEPFGRCLSNNQSIQVEGGSCMSSFGPGHIEWNEPNPSRGLRRMNVGGDCYKCPDEVTLGCGMPPHFMCTTEMRRGTPFQRQCIDKGFTTTKSRPV